MLDVWLFFLLFSLHFSPDRFTRIINTSRFDGRGDKMRDGRPHQRQTRPSHLERIWTARQTFCTKRKQKCARIRYGFHSYRYPKLSVRSYSKTRVSIHRFWQDEMISYFNFSEYQTFIFNSWHNTTLKYKGKAIFKPFFSQVEKNKH